MPDLADLADLADFGRNGAELFWESLSPLFGSTNVLPSVGPNAGSNQITLGTHTVARMPTLVDEHAMIETFDSYYRRDYRRLVGLAYVLTGSRWAAEDLAQDALTEAHRKWKTVSGYDDPAGWVRRVMVNKSTSRLRRLRTETKGLMRLGARRPETIAPSEPAHEVLEAVRRLPTRQAQAVALFYWEDCSIDRIATVLDVSTETAKTHLKRARATLADQLEAHRENRS